MRLQPPVDPSFINASSFLKNILIDGLVKEGIGRYKCLDLPCGNGRNTFLLASHFEAIVAVDIEPRYLNAVNESKSAYEKQNIQLVQQDILAYPIKELDQYNFICNIHFYDERLICQLLANMRKGAVLLIETPSCHGENFRTLPNEAELKELFEDRDILKYEFRICKHAENRQQRGSLKTIIKI